MANSVSLGQDDLGVRLHPDAGIQNNVIGHHQVVRFQGKTDLLECAVRVGHSNPSAQLVSTYNLHPARVMFIVIEVSTREGQADIHLLAASSESKQSITRDQ